MTERLDGGSGDDRKTDVLLGLMAKPSGGASAAPGKPKGSLIQEVGAAAAEQQPEPPVGASTPAAAAPSDDSPSMMEMIMAAQAEAAGLAKKEKEVETKKMNKGFGSGFKKGFFGGSGGGRGADEAKSKGKSKATTTSSALSGGSATDIPTITGSGGKKGAGGRFNVANDAKTKVLDEVQAAIAAEQASKVAGMGGQEWATPDLMQAFAGNPVLARGLMNPKCNAALQAMQGNNQPGPNASAEEKSKHAAKMNAFKHDPEVDAFVREFGRVMGGHFEKLGEKQDAELKAAESAKKQTRPLVEVVQGARPQVEELDDDGNPFASSIAAAATVGTMPEMGPLHKAAVERESKAKAAAAVAAGGGAAAASKVAEEGKPKAKPKAAASAPPGGGPSGANDAAVQAVVNDPELSALLMDPAMQRTLQECGDPAKFQRHMQNAETARKIKKLFDAGLVGTAK